VVIAILVSMKRGKGVRKNAIILISGFIAGLFLLSQFVSTTSNADAAANLSAEFLTFAENPSQDVQGIDFPIVAQSQALESKNVNFENPLPERAQDVLTSEQQQHLQDASMEYIALTPVDGIRMARSLNIVKDDGDPTNVCGPLSIAILRDAGLLDPYIKIRDFWLLNPDTNRKLLDLTFSSDRYEHFQFSSPLNEMNWDTFPLKSGDFLYIYAGPGGTFEHMLVVTRVDNAGRAFSVTNHATPDGFVIDEVLLYDPAQPGTGKFFEWTVRRNNKLGSTGFGGFELWRLAVPFHEKSPREIAFARELDAVMEEHGGDWYVAVKDLSGGMLYERQAAVPVDVGSMIKLPVAMLFFKSLELEEIPPASYADYISEEGPDRSYEQLLRAMFNKSDMVAAQTLLDEIRISGLDVDEQLTKWGLRKTNLDSGKLSIQDMVAVYEGLYSGDLVDVFAREYILSLMEESASNNSTRLGILQKTNPSSLKFDNRRGSTVDTIIAIGDGALVSVPVVDGEDTYIVVMSGYFSEDKPTTDQELIKAIEEMAQVFWSFTRK
jgi:Beta-lactamase enzyme family